MPTQAEQVLAEVVSSLQATVDMYHDHLLEWEPRHHAPMDNYDWIKLVSEATVAEVEPSISGTLACTLTLAGKPYRITVAPDLEPATSDTFSTPEFEAGVDAGYRIVAAQVKAEQEG
jgi:hypothetical protein